MDLTRIPVLDLAKRSDQEQWFYHTDFTARAREVKSDLRVFLRQRGDQVNWVVTDRDPQGADYITMTVQEADGSYRPFDGRTLTTLRKLFHVGPDLDAIVRELEAREAAKRRAEEQRDQEIADGVAADLAWAGRDVVSSVAWRERTVRTNGSPSA